MSEQERTTGIDATVSDSSRANLRASKNFLGSWWRSQRDPHALPEGVNDFDSPLSDAHPVPVVLIHGTWLNQANSWGMIAPRLVKDGYRVFSLNYGKDDQSIIGKYSAGAYASGGLVESQPEVARFIDEVLERTGAERVDLIGHSQGAAQARMYLTESGGKGNVRKLIGVSPSNHGTTLSGITHIGNALEKIKIPAYAVVEKLLGKAANDQVVGSDAMTRINREGDTVPGVEYTMMATRFDEVVTPWHTQFLEDSPQAPVRNILLQEGAVRDFSDHLAVLYSPKVIDLISEVLSEDPEEYRSTHDEVSSAMVPLWGRAPRLRGRR